MKTLPTQILALLHSRGGARRHLRVLVRFGLALGGMIASYSVIFHLLMLREGQDHTWFTGLYWTLTVMSTLGFGDITFHTDLGRAFSTVVLLSGVLFLLVLLPFTFIEFFYEPWMRLQEQARAPREVPADVSRHVLLTHRDSITSELIRRLDQYQTPYSLVVADLDETLRLHDQGLHVVLGQADDPETWKRLGVERAALVVVTGSDVANTTAAFTVRGVSTSVPIIATAHEDSAVDVLTLAGANQVLRMEEMIGQSISRRTIGPDAVAHVIGRFDDLLIAEATARRTPLVGKTLRENALRQKIGVSVIGTWERGTFEPARPDTRIHDNTVLVLAGSTEQIARYNELFIIYNVSDDPVVILGGGRVGRATARALAAREVDYRIVEILPERTRDPERTVIGNAAELEVLQRAGLAKAPTVIITPHDDEMNVYLTLYCRRLRPDIQIIARSTLERNVATLHRAGADSVLSYAGTGASSIMNWLRYSKMLMVAEGLDLFRMRVPARLEGRTIAESGIRDKTGCTVVGISRAGGGMDVVPDPSVQLPAGCDMVLIGTDEAERRCLELFGDRT